MLNYLLECHIDYDLPYLYGLKIQKNFRSLCTLVIKIHESCCSIFNELCFLPNLAADSLIIIPLSHPFVKTFSKLFCGFFRSGFEKPSRVCPIGECDTLFVDSFDSIPHSSHFVNPFFKVFSGFLPFPGAAWGIRGDIKCFSGFCVPLRGDSRPMVVSDKSNLSYIIGGITSGAIYHAGGILHVSAPTAAHRIGDGAGVMGPLLSK